MIFATELSTTISNLEDNIYEADDDIFEYLRTSHQGKLQTEYGQLNFSITDSEVHKTVSQERKRK